MSLPSRLLLLATLSILAACSNSLDRVSDPDDFEAYISAFSGPVIARTSPILVTFTAPYGEGRESKPVQGDLFVFQPGISGVASWEDAYTLKFTPKDPLPSGKSYQAAVRLNQLVKGLPDSLQMFRFALRVKDQFLRMDIEDLTIPDASKPDNFELSGVLHTNDMAAAEDVEAAFAVAGIPGKVNLAWSHDPAGMNHHFTLSDIPRQANDHEIRLSFSGKPLSLDQSGEEVIVIPGQASFRVARMRIEQGSQSIIHLAFSHLLRTDQDLTGKIFIRERPGIEPRFVINGNQVTGYLPERLDGIFHLEVTTGVVDQGGRKLTQPYSARTSFTQVPPQVRLVGNGMILPRSEALYFPFEAVNLDAVQVEVFKIYQGNILQFLQVNNLDGNYELQRVGKLIASEKVDLSSLNPEGNQFEWVRYALDLATFIERDPQAIYQVRIGFWPEFSTYACPEEYMSTNEITEEPDGESEEWYGDTSEPESMMDAYWGPYGYRSDYSWENRDNPCAPEYYNADRFVSRNVLASDLGLTVKMTEGLGVLALVTDLRTTDPVSGAEVTFYDPQLQKIQSVRTDDRGLFLGQLKARPEVAVVRTKQSSGYLVLRQNESLSSSDFETSGDPVQKGLRGYPYAERGVWRPGDSLFLNLILHDPDHTLPATYPVTLELYDPRGRLVDKVVNARPEGRIYSYPIRTNPDAPTGSWHAKYLAGGAVFHQYLRVETIKPNRLKLKLDFARKRLSIQDEPVQATLKAEWLHGAPVKQQEAQIEARPMAIRTGFKGFEAFTFYQADQPTPSFSEFVWAKGQTDERGQLAIRGKRLLSEQQLPGRLRIDFKFRVNEPGGGFSQDFTSIEYDPYTSYCGVSIPRNAYGAPSFAPDEKVTLTFACVNTDGQPIAGRKLTVKKIRKEWRWWWERYRDNRMDYNQQEGQLAEEEQTVTTDRQGKAQWKLSFSEFARYKIEVIDPISGHSASDHIYIYDDSSPANQDARYFAFSTDQETYAPGEDIKIQLPGANAGRALISVESGSGILEAHLVNLQPNQTLYKLKVRKEMLPNVYLHVAMLQPHDLVGNDLPLRLYSIRSIQVQDPDSRLQPELTVPAEMRPDQPYAIKVKEAKGKTMSYTLALVDEGLLDLTHFPTPDPHARLFSKQALGVQTWDVYDQVLGGFGGELRRIVAIGGDGAGARPDGSPKANRFKPAIVHLGPFTLKGGRTASHQVTIPNYVGSVRCMVVAAADGAYGSTEKTIPVRKPLMVQATLPRVLGIRESLDIPITVFAMEPSVRKVEVTITESSRLVQLGASNKSTLTFTRPDEQQVSIPVKVSDRSGVARFRIEARSNNEVAVQEIEVEIRNPNPLQTLTHTALLRPGESTTFEVPLAGTPGTNTARLEGFALPPADVTRHLNDLMNYPYGCLEQTTSKALPLLYLSRLTPVPDAAARDIRDRVEGAIQRILSLKDGSGHIAYWPNGQYQHPWSEIYAALFLNLAKKEGYTVPESQLKSIMTTQKRMANEWSSTQKALLDYGQYTSSLQAFRLFMLAVAGEPQLGAMNRFREVPGRRNLDNWLLAAAYARAGQEQVGKRIAASLDRSVSVYRDSRTTFGSDVLDLGIMVIALLDLQDRSRAFPVLKTLAERMNSSRWYSTQSVAFGLWAYATYAASQPEQGNPSLTWELANGTRKQEASNLQMIRVDLQPSLVQNKPLTVTNTSRADLYVQLSLTGRPDLGQEVAAANGIDLRIDYQLANGQPVRIDQIPRGTDFLAVATLTNTLGSGEAISEVALSQIIPAGWEIRNLRMDPGQVNQVKQSYSKYQDIRDDRMDSFFDLRSGRDDKGRKPTQTYVLALTASYPGRYYLPAQKAEAMYDPSLQAIIPGKWVTVLDPQDWTDKN
ncbi:MAG: hypothetical protein H6568_03570 [Lewinellaceae bacterium]|nr:hypothetical protein [Saprospiraceae bacterium]MCB9311821.1 hypothetical protein [Lewinellaceae bacterium]